MIWNMRRRKKKLYKWLFNERMIIDRNRTFYAAFYSNGEKFSSIKVSKGYIRIMDYDSVRIYSYGDGNSKWHKGAAYRTVAFTEPPTGELLAFLQEFATPL